MRRASPFLIAAAFVLALWLCWPAEAQQPPPNPKADNYRQLYHEAADRLVALAVQMEALQAENAQLKAQVEKQKVEEKPK